MKKILLLLLVGSALFSSSIEQLSLKTKQIDEDRKSSRQILSMDIDIREFRRSHIVEKRKLQSIVVSKMIRIKNNERG